MSIYFPSNETSGRYKLESTNTDKTKIIKPDELLNNRLISRLLNTTSILKTYIIEKIYNN